MMLVRCSISCMERSMLSKCMARCGLQRCRTQDSVHRPLRFRRSHLGTDERNLSSNCSPGSTHCTNLQSDETYMQMALEEARQAARTGEVPVGAVLVGADGSIIASAHNTTHNSQNPIAHAEVLCIQQAAAAKQAWRLLGATLYVTLEPCVMCAGAILQCRLKRVVYGAPQPRIGARLARVGHTFDPDLTHVLTGAAGSWINIIDSQQDGGPIPAHPYHPSLVVSRGVLSDDCAAIVTTFFRERRLQNKQRKEQQQAAAATEAPFVVWDPITSVAGAAVNDDDDGSAADGDDACSIPAAVKTNSMVVAPLAAEANACMVFN